MYHNSSGNDTVFASAESDEASVNGSVSFENDLLVENASGERRKGYGKCRRSEVDGDQLRKP